MSGRIGPSVKVVRVSSHESSEAPRKTHGLCIIPGGATGVRRLVRTVCPHDCPSACSLDVQVADGRVGTVRGAATTPTPPASSARRSAATPSGSTTRTGSSSRWSASAPRAAASGGGSPGTRRSTGVAAAFTRDRASATAPEAVWPYYSAGTMGLVQRDGIHRLTPRDGLFRGASAPSAPPSPIAGWSAGVGRIAGPDPREMAQSDLIVVWGGNPVSTQVNVMTHISRARKKRGAKLVVIDPYRTGTAAVADLHLAPRPGTDGALACAVIHVPVPRRLRRPGLPGAPMPRTRRRWRRISPRAARPGRPAITGLDGRGDRGLRGRSTARRRAATSAAASASPGPATAPSTCTR